MALSFVEYTSDGVTTQYDLTFGYLSKNHVFVFVDGELRSFSWVSATRVELTTAPDPDQTVKVQRLTDRATRITDYSDGQTLLAGDLNAGDLQNFYIVQEMIDEIYDGVLTGTVPVTNPDSGYLTVQWVNSQLEQNQYTSQAYTELLQRIADEEVARAQAVSAEAAARADDVFNLTAEDLAQGQRLDTLETTVDTPVTGLTARMGTLETTAVDLENSKAEASSLTALQAIVEDPSTGLPTKASITSLNTAIATEQAARASDISAVTVATQAAQADATSALQLIATEETARIDDVNTLTTAVNSAQADATSALSLVATEETARISDVNSLTVSVNTAQSTADNNAILIANETTARSSALDSLEAQFRNEMPRNNLIPGPYRVLEESDWVSDSKFVRTYNATLVDTGQQSPWTSTDAFKFTTSAADGRVAFTPELSGVTFFDTSDRIGVLLDSGKDYALKMHLAIDVNASACTLYARGNDNGGVYTVGTFTPTGATQVITSSWSPPSTQKYSFELQVTSTSGTSNNWLYRLQLVHMFTGENHADIPWIDDDGSAYNEAAVNILKDALATGSSSQARLFLSVNTTNNSASFEAYAGEGDGVWNGSAINLTASEITLDGDVVITGTLTGDKIEIGGLTKAGSDSATSAVALTTSWQDVAQFTLDIPANASLVKLDASASSVGSSTTASSGATLYARVLRDGVDITGQIEVNSLAAPALINVSGGSTGLETVTIPDQIAGTDAFVVTDVGAATGTRTYKLQYKLSTTTGTFWTLKDRTFVGVAHAR